MIHLSIKFMYYYEFAGKPPGPCAGCSQESPVTSEIAEIASNAASLLAFTAAGDGCGQVNLVEVVRAETQVVAGTNYILSLRLSTNCRTRREKICDNIVVYQPLPFDCPAGGDCLEIIRQEEIACTESQGSL